jgi:hypothetical protein
MYELTHTMKCILCFVLREFVVSYTEHGDCGATIRLNYTAGEVSCFDKPHQRLAILPHKAAFMKCKNIPSFHRHCHSTLSAYSPSSDVCKLQPLNRMSKLHVVPDKSTVLSACRAKNIAENCDDTQHQQRHAKIFSAQNCGRTRLASGGAGGGGGETSLGAYS